MRRRTSPWQWYEIRINIFQHIIRRKITKKHMNYKYGNGDEKQIDRMDQRCWRYIRVSDCMLPSNHRRSHTADMFKRRVCIFHCIVMSSEREANMRIDTSNEWLMKITRDWIIKTNIWCSSHMFARMMAERANRVDVLLHLVLSSPRSLCIRLTVASVFTSRTNSCLRAINGRPRTIMTFTHFFLALELFSRDTFVHSDWPMSGGQT